MRILALATNPATAASTRFRVLQWEPFLRQAGFSLTVESFFSDEDSPALYQRGRWPEKLACGVRGGLRRLMSLRRAAQGGDVLLIHREAFPLGWPVFLNMIQRFPGAVVYDYDDAMFLPQRQGRGLIARLEHLETPAQLMAHSDVVLAGNEFLAEHARRHTPHVVLLPTCIDPARFRPPAARRTSSTDRVVVGWIGSHSTTKYLENLLPTLERVARQTPFRLLVVGGGRLVGGRGLEVEQVAWALPHEVEYFQRCDIGIYPLWNDPWAQGKCGFKAIQFMACAVPVVASAVGVNRTIIQDGIDGFLAETEQDWIERLQRLIREVTYRRQIGAAGRKTVVARYAIGVHAPTLLGWLCEAIERKRTARSNGFAAGPQSSERTLTLGEARTGP